MTGVRDPSVDARAVGHNEARAGEGAQEALGHLLGDGLDLTHGAILYLDSVSVSFDGFKALNRLSLAVDDGELRCIIGPNGAGKTTMMDCITGKTRPDSGTVFFGSTIDLTKMNEAAIVHAGIGRKFQRPTVFETLSVLENMELAIKTAKGPWASLRARLSGEQLDRIEATLVQVHLRDQVERLAGVLSHGQKQWLEIAMLLVQEPRLLLLDEPVAGMTDAETERTAELFLSLAGRHSLVVVEHDMDFVSRIAGKVTVLHEGSVLAEGSMDLVRNDPKVIEVYLGR
ncbi:MAG: urea ABC transporter ATP-binding protein UrtD [Lautropia sp.]